MLTRSSEGRQFKLFLFFFLIEITLFLNIIYTSSVLTFPETTWGKKKFILLHLLFFFFFNPNVLNVKENIIFSSIFMKTILIFLAYMKRIFYLSVVYKETKVLGDSTQAQLLPLG